MRTLAILPVPRAVPRPSRAPLAAAALGLALAAARPLVAQASAPPAGAPPGGAPAAGVPTAGSASARVPAGGQRAPTGLPPAGSPVRLLVAGATAANGLPGLPFGTPTRATFLAADSASLTVRVGGGWEHTLPAADVTRLEVRRGRGRCGGAARRTLCVVGGVALGFGAGYLIDRAFDVRDGARAVIEPGSTDDGLGDLPQARRTARIAGVSVGLAVGALLGRDRWTRITPWTTR